MGPLSGIRVVDLSVVVSGPLATMVLSDQGADVVKVESPGLGDIVRYLGSSRNGVSGLFANCNRGKRSVTLDTTNDQGRGVLRRLVADADVVVQNFRPGAAARMGVGWDDVAADNPGLVYVSISGFGATGPRAKARVYDNVIQGYSGVAAVQSDAGGQPSVVRQLLCDKVTAMTVAQGVTAALLARERDEERRGQHLEVAMLDASVAFLWPDAMMADTLLGEGVTAALPIARFYRAAPTADGWYTSTAVSDGEWRGLCTALGTPELADDPRFSTIGGRMANALEMLGVVDAITTTLSTAELLARLEANDVPCAPLQHPSELADDPQVRHNELLFDRDDPVVGPLRQPRSPLRFSVSDTDAERDVPALGQHTEEVLAEAGYGPDELVTLRQAGAFGPVAIAAATAAPGRGA